MAKSNTNIVIIEPSAIVYEGLCNIIAKTSEHFHVFRLDAFEQLEEFQKHNRPDILIINPAFWGHFDIARLKEETANPKLKSLALLYSSIDVSLLRNYNDTISIFESVEQLKEKLEKLFESPSGENTDETNALSIREKEIITCVVKGLTNKEIATELFLSTHTVISHRRNIARKLEIHSTAGLTIYAIVNKLVELEEIKKNMLL